MKIVMHLGLHCTDGGLLIRSILQNRARLAENGVSVPGPLNYRELLGEASTRLRGDAASEETEAMIVETFAIEPDCHRVILSNENFLCRSNAAIAEDCLYPKAEKSSWLRKCLPSHEVEFALALRNPAGLLPDLIAGLGGPAPSEDLLHNGIWLNKLRWPDVLRRIARANPGARLLVWCHEDTPFIWPQVQRELAGLDAGTRLDGELDMIETIMKPEGYERLSKFLDTRDVSNPSKRRRAVTAFLEAHAIDEAIEAEIDLPGWTDETIEELTAHYDEDTETIAAMPEVTFISP